MFFVVGIFFCMGMGGVCIGEKSANALTSLLRINAKHAE